MALHFNKVNAFIKPTLHSLVLEGHQVHRLFHSLQNPPQCDVKMFITATPTPPIDKVFVEHTK